jgi:hypothetical protein
VAGADTPLWRKAFDGVENRIGRPLESATGSSQFHTAILTLRGVKRAVIGPVQSVVGFGLHLAGLPSHKDVRELSRTVCEVEREVLALRRDIVQAERDRREPE